MTLFFKFPVWIEYSGLPEKLAKEISPFAYFLLKKIVELDLFQNQYPDIVNTSISELSLMLGIEEKVIKDLLQKLQEKNYINIYKEGSDSVYIVVNIPLNTPISPEDLPISKGGTEGEKRTLYYYNNEVIDFDSNELDDDRYKNIKYEQILNLYMQIISSNINPSIMQKLKYISENFPYDKIKDCFIRARKNNVRSLQWLMKELSNYKNS